MHSNFVFLQKNRPESLAKLFTSCVVNENVPRAVVVRQDLCDQLARRVRRRRPGVQCGGLVEVYFGNAKRNKSLTNSGKNS